MTRGIARKRATLIGALIALALGAGAGQASTTTYGYDALGRLISTAYGSTTVSYTYDAAGNRTQVAISAAPIAGAVSLSVAANSSSNAVTLSLSGGTATSVTVSTGASHGSASASGTSITYTPTSGYSGSDSFQYTATNAMGTSSPATVSVTVTSTQVANGTVLFTTSSLDTFSYTVPSGVSYVDVELWGHGADAYYEDWGGGEPFEPTTVGGSGGSYSKKHFAVTTGQVISGAIGYFSTYVTSPSFQAGGWGNPASGGDVNTSNSTIPTTYVGQHSANGGGDQSGFSGNGNFPGGGGAGYFGLGADGQVKITARTS